ncbi:ATP-binding Cassette (ABC) superfamily, partial [Thraustotheca clavata]
TGSHAQLMAVNNGIYRLLVELQEGTPLPGDQDNEAYFNKITQAMAADPDAADIIRKYSNVSAINLDLLPPVHEQPSDISFWRIMALTKPQRGYLIAGFIACIMNGFSMPGISVIISNVISSMQKYYTLFLITKQQSFLDTLYDDIRTQSYIFIGVAGAMFLVGYVQTYSFRIIAEKLTTRLRNMHFKALVHQDIGFFDEEGHATGALTTDLATYATKVVVVAGENQARILQALFTFIAGLIISFGFGSWQLTLVMLAVFPLMVLGWVARSRGMQGQNVADTLTDSGAIATEAIVNARTVTAFGLQEVLVEKYDALLEKPMKDGVREAQINGVMNGFSGFTMFATYALVFWYGAKLIHDQTISFSEMMRTLMAIMMAAQGVGQTAGWMGDTDAAKKAAREIFAIIERKPIIDSSKVNDGIIPSTIQGRIVFKDVHFHYPTRPNVPVLKQYNLTIEPGQTVAFCGPSGGGKSTVVALIERFYQQQKGSITLDGCELASLNLPWLRNQIGLVGQEPVLFVGTIAENIAGGLSSTDDTDNLQHVEEAAKMANAHNFITQFPDGYQTQVGLKGDQLSGGQKQRIAIARAIMKNPSILLLDEATSALDSESEKVVQEALDTLLAAKGRTTLVIAHRLSTIRNADKICVVSGGHIAEEGTHDELMQLNGIYTQLASHNEP